MSNLLIEKVWKPGQQPKIYLHPSEDPPKGRKKIKGPRGGEFYYLGTKEDFGYKKEGKTLAGSSWERPKGNKTANGSTIDRKWNPAFTFINRDPKARIQAIGRDSKGRLKYHLWDEAPNKATEKKQKKLKKWSRDLKGILQIIERDMKGKDKNKQELALICKIMYKTGFRVGQEEEHRKTGDVTAYGVRSLLRKHVTVLKGDKVKFEFPGKDGVPITGTIIEPALANRIKKIKNPEKRIFSAKYKGKEGVLEYTRNFSSKKNTNYTPHDFRTHVATNEAAKFLEKLKKTGHKLAEPKNVKEFKALQRLVGKFVGGLKEYKDKGFEISETPLFNSYRKSLQYYISREIWLPFEAKFGLGLFQKEFDLFHDIHDIAERVHYSNPPEKNKKRKESKNIRREIDSLVERSYQKSFEDNNRSENWVNGIIEKSKIELQKQEDDDDNPIDSHLESQYEERFESDD